MHKLYGLVTRCPDNNRFMSIDKEAQKCVSGMTHHTLKYICLVIVLIDKSSFRVTFISMYLLTYPVSPQVRPWLLGTYSWGLGTF